MPPVRSPRTVRIRLDALEIPILGFLSYAVSDRGLVIAAFFHHTSDDAQATLRNMLDAMTGYETENGVPSDRLIWHQRFLTFFAGGAAAKNPEEVPFEDRHWTPFQAVVYRVLRDNVRWGETISYGELASLAGFPGAARAVGHAMARNTGGPFVPCHRVIAARGAIGGYSGTGGVRLKRALLAYERKQPLIRSEGPEHPLDHHPGNSIPSRRS